MAQDSQTGVAHLVEIVVAQAVSEIQVWWLPWNRISTGSRIKSYIHGVRGSRAAVAHGADGFCRLQSKRAERQTEKKRGGETDPSFVGVNEIRSGKGLVSIFLFLHQVQALHV